MIPEPGPLTLGQQFQLAVVGGAFALVFRELGSEQEVFLGFVEVTQLEVAHTEQVVERGLTGLAGLVLLLNLYALAAIAYRTVEYGVTPNRFAVLGWNVVTAIVLGYVLRAALASGTDDWSAALRRAVGRGIALPVAWALVLLCALSLDHFSTSIQCLEAKILEFNPHRLSRVQL